MTDPVKQTHFEAEIREQPAALARLLDRGQQMARQMADSIRRANPANIVIAARGSSDNAGRYARYLFGIQNRVLVTLATPSLFTHYQSPPDLRRSVVLAISQSGEAPDILAVIEAAKQQGAPTFAVTNDPESPLAAAADLCLCLEAGPERAVAATKTYTNELLAMAMLSTALDPSPERWRELSNLPELVEQVLSMNSTVSDGAVRFRYAGHFVVIGRGYNYATAFELALKIKETSYVVAEPYSSADFLHGPVALIEEGFPAIVLAPSGAVFDDVASLLGTLMARKAEIIGISDNADFLMHARTPLRLPTGVPEWLSPIVTIVPGQLWAGALASVRGLDPDEPRGLHKITRTV